jgi:hypothetical protein
LLSSAPTDGNFSFVTGFDGDGPGVISLAQDLSIPAKQSKLLFDLSTEWNLADFASSSLDRSFSIVIEPSGGGAPLGMQEVLHVPAQSVDSLLGATALVDLGEFAGQDVRLKFAWDVPESFSGPALFDLDHVRLAGKALAEADAASLDVGIHMAQDAHDTVRLIMEVNVPEAFDPDGAQVTVHVGNTDAGFTLDATGVQTGADFLCKVKPDGGDPALMRLTMVLTQDNVLAELQPFGLDDVDTPKGGITALVPVSVDDGGTHTNKDVLVVYTAKQGKTGSAKGRSASEALAARLGVKLDFGTQGHDAVTLKTSAFTAPGFLPEGLTASVSVGSFLRTFTLDAAGHAEVEDATLDIKRIGRNPALQTVSFKCSHADVQSALAADGLADADVAKPGDVVLLPVTIKLDGRATRLIVPVTYTAKTGASGHGAGKL